MKKIFTLIILASFSIFAQNIDVIDGQTILANGTGTIYDDGGPSGDYSAYQTWTVTLYSCGGGAIELDVTFLDTESGYDYLNIYDGASTGSPSLGSFDGTVAPGVITSSGGFITIEFVSDVGTVEGGFAIDFSVPSEGPAILPSATVTQNCNSDLTYELIVNITNLNGAGGADINIAGSNVESNVGTGTYTYVGLSGDVNVEVLANGASCGTDYNILACDVCALTSAPTDDPCSAPAVDLSQPFYGSTSCSYTPTSSSPSGCGSIENDSWLTFTASDDTVILDWEVIYDATDCADGVQFSIWDGSCSLPGSMVELACQNPALYTGDFIIPDLTIGEEYFIRIDGFAGDLCDYSWEARDGVATTPENDDCPSADTIACGETGNLTNIVLASDADAPASVCTGVAGKGIWYIIQGTGGDVTLTTDNTGTNFDTQINVFTGTCGSLTCIAGDDDGGVTISNASTVTFSSTAGTYYYVYIDGDGSAQGEFVLSATCTSCPAEAGTWN